MIFQRSPRLDTGPTTSTTELLHVVFSNFLTRFVVSKVRPCFELLSIAPVAKIGIPFCCFYEKEKVEM
jgi:hypothetical protein